MPVTRKVPKSWQTKKDMEEDCNALFSRKNTVYANKGNETPEHFMVKAMLIFILKSRGAEAYSELKIEGGIIDVFDITNRVIYEIETDLTEGGKQEKVEKYDSNYIREFIFINLKKVPMDILEMQKYLTEKIEALNSD